MSKRVMRLRESDLNKIVSEAVRKIVREDRDSIMDYKDLPKRGKSPFDPYDDYEDENEEIRMGVLESFKRRRLNEGNYDDNPIKKWVYWTFNYHNPEKWIGIFKGAPKSHFLEKFYSSSDMNRFFVELDSTNQDILADYVMNNY